MDVIGPCRGEFSVAATHPCVPGHFPGNPIVPGVVLLDEAFAIVLAARPNSRIAAVEAVKFLQPVLPEQSVAVEWEEIGFERIAFCCTVGDRTVLRGQARLSRR